MSKIKKSKKNLNPIATGRKTFISYLILFFVTYWYNYFSYLLITFISDWRKYRIFEIL